jgi:hypothetical protein
MMSDITVKRIADGSIMKVHKDIVPAFINSGWVVYVEDDAETAEKPEIAASEPTEAEAEEVPTEAKKPSARGRKRATRG